MLITPYDLLVPLGEPATLEVEVEERWMAFVDPPAAGIEVELEGVGRAKSGKNGIATFDLGVLPEGTHRPVIRFNRKSVEAVVRVVPRETPVIIIDIDETIADVTPWGFIVRRVRNVLPLSGAREILKEISRTMQIVYLKPATTSSPGRRSSGCGWRECPRRRFISGRARATGGPRPGITSSSGWASSDRDSRTFPGESATSRGTRPPTPPGGSVRS